MLVLDFMEFNRSNAIKIEAENMFMNAPTIQHSVSTAN